MVSWTQMLKARERVRGDRAKPEVHLTTQCEGDGARGTKCISRLLAYTLRELSGGALHMTLGSRTTPDKTWV